MKKILFFTALILSFPLYNAISAGNTAQYNPRADLDSNGMINSQDLNILTKIISGEWETTDCDANNACGCYCDVNGDGVCDEKDIADLKSRMNTGYKSGYSAQIDYNKDYLIDYEDLLVFNRDWGRRDCRIGNICDCGCDLNFDGICDESDFNIFSQYYKHPTGLGYDPRYDLNLDGKIDSSDLDFFNKIYSGAFGQAECLNNNICACNCDLNKDGKCDLLDRLELTARLNSTAKKDYDPKLDYNLDYKIDEKDLTAFNRDWNKKNCLAEACGCSCDINNDGVCDMADFEIFRQYYDPIVKSKYHPKFDFNTDGYINFLDYNIFMNIYNGNYDQKACESHNACACTCDLNGDGVCDLYDIIEYKKHEHSKAKDGYCARCDFNKDYAIDYDDVLIFDRDWRRTDCEIGNYCDCECDLNDDGKCDTEDIDIFTQFYNIDEDPKQNPEMPEISDTGGENIEDEFARNSSRLNSQMDLILAEIGEKADSAREAGIKNKYLTDLAANMPGLNEQAEASLIRFLSYGADPNTKRLGAGERAAVLFSYKYAFDKLPGSEDELADVLKIANGRWPAETSRDAEFKARTHFRTIYKRISDLDIPQDNAAITIMAYGLRQRAENRNLESEKAGIITFKHIYGYHPKTTEDWNIMQAITYSGAVRMPDRDKDFLPDAWEAMYGTDPDNPDTNGNGFLDGIEVEEGYLKKIF